MPTVKNEFSNRHADILELIKSRTLEGATASELSFEIKSLNCQELIVVIQKLLKDLEHTMQESYKAHVSRTKKIEITKEISP